MGNDVSLTLLEGINAIVLQGKQPTGNPTATQIVAA